VACAAVIHDWMARRPIGSDALAIERHWRFLYERAANVGVRGAEIRALSVIDVALWDVLGQVCGQPIYRLLGGPVCDRIPVYSSLGHPGYGVLPIRRHGTHERADLGRSNGKKYQQLG
jgi:L-alanine-DL-glutamate epimerase-like enolase superfamily enzyme